MIEWSHALAAACHAATLQVASDPRLLAFAGWPHAAIAPKPAVSISAAAILREWESGHIPETADLHDAMRAIVDLVEWQQTYTEEEVGADYLNRFGYFELVGPKGHFQTPDLRAYVAYWGAGLTYDWHLNQAEELYYIISGEALFMAEGTKPAVLKPGDVRLHRSNQPHAKTTTHHPILALVLWRGDGLLGIPRMEHT